MQDEKDDIFGEPIYSYTDKQAIDDGVLVDISELNIQFRSVSVNRMTRTLWEEFQPFLLDHSEAEKQLGIKMPSKMEQLRSILKTKLNHAKQSGEDDFLFILPPEIWMVKNELGTYTIMKPEDY
jgi:type I site-specific restriction-modification system R (restriction) subunit